MAKVRISMALHSLGIIPLVVVADSFQAVCDKLEANGFLDGMNPDNNAFGRFFGRHIIGIFEHKEPGKIKPVTSPLIVPAR